MGSSLVAALVLLGHTPAWSPAVNGLEGRIEVCAVDSKYSAVDFAPYLVLHNRNFGNVAIRFEEDFDNLKLKLVDAKGVEIGQGSSGEHDGIVPPPFQTNLPSDATIRLNVTTTGFGIPIDSALMVQAGEFGLFVPKDFVGQAFLTGTYSVAKPSTNGPSGWAGALNLPKVLVWNDRSPVHPPKSQFGAAPAFPNVGR
jgi:hypothetical protein